MFVSKRRWILKTCGTTTPLKCLGQLLKLAEANGYNVVADLFYSRKNFTRPEAQVGKKINCISNDFISYIFR